MNDFLNLLLDFQGLPREAKARTFMEVSGQAHYENVASDILAFYFDSHEEHGLGDLLITSFLEIAGHPEVRISNRPLIRRERSTEDRKRIDLVIQVDGFVIGIENKIHHTENNDFVNYGRMIDAIAAENVPKVKAVLCLRAEKWMPQLPADFVRFSYGQLWKQVRKSLGRYLPAATPKWVTYLLEFMETTSRLAGESQPNREFADFFIRHYATIDQLIAEKQTLIDRLQGYNSAIERELKDGLLKQECITGVSVKNGGIDFFVDIVIRGHLVHLDLAIWGVAWRLMLWSRDHDSQMFLHGLAKSESIQAGWPGISFEGERYLLKSWDIHVTQIELQEAVLKCANVIIAAAAELPPPASDQAI